jgi:hypothetical protein
MPRNSVLRGALLEIAENQLRDGTRPETRSTLERLLRDGFTREEAIDLIACAVTSEFFDMMKQGQPYQESRFVAALQALPQLPWEVDEAS